MIAHSILRELILVMGVSLITVFLAGRLRLPAIVGFMAAGLLIGPGILGLVQSREHIEVLAEVGVVLLLFSVGLHLSIRDLWRLRGTVFGAGGLQVLLTLAAVQTGLVLLGVDWRVAAACGAAVALSSTALVVRLLQERGETDSAHGRWMLGILLMQDLAVVPILFALPFLAQGEGARWTDLGLVAAEAAGVVALVIAGAWLLFPLLARLTVRTRSREIFTLMVTVVVFGTALLVAEAGLSMALGAFLAGVIISESEYCQQIVADLAPMREVFSGLFFVSVGMLVDVPAWIDAPGELLPAAAGIILVKLAILAVLAAASSRSLWFALVAGAGLCHAGEFSFVIAQSALDAGVLDADAYRTLISASVPTMLLAPFALAAASKLRSARTGREAAAQVAGGWSAPDGRPHVIVVGYGFNGQNVARVLGLLDVPFMVVELNPVGTRKLAEEGLPSLHGDATQLLVLEAAGLARAQALVVTVADATTCRQIVSVARRHRPDLSIIARTRYLREVEELHRLGADDVVPEEYETSLELAGRVLATYGTPDGLIEREKALLRESRYQALSQGGQPLAQHALRAMLSSIALEEVTVSERAVGDGRSLKELGVRERTGATVLALLRGRKLTGNPSADLRIDPSDVLIVAGTPQELDAARQLLAAGDARGSVPPEQARGQAVSSRWRARC